MAKKKSLDRTILRQNLLTGEKATLRLENNDVIDFLKSLKKGRVDVLCTDPPYSGMNQYLKLGKGRIVGKYKDKGKKEGKWFAEFADTAENYKIFLKQCQRVLNPETGHLYLMFDSYSMLTLAPLVREYFSVKNLIVWDKVNIGMGHYFRRRHEFILFATHNNTRKIKNRSFPDVWRFKRLHKAPWPTQKPVELFQAMIHASVEPGMLVCDPFMGAGSSAVAALKNECNFVGCDSNKKAYKLAVKRLSGMIDAGKDYLQPKPAALPGDKVFWE
jgi:site-specific DNA-methyltransferase (adenine-specific)